ncbi:MAG: MBL fold metallo-hydrolase [Verrucomicrobiota bacterium]
MELVFLGTGTSQGVPMIAQAEGLCDLEDRRNWRTRCSAHIRMGEVGIQVDAGQEFRLQCIENKIPSVEYFILTHGHADHILGMDDLRRYCDMRDGEALPVYSTELGLQRVRAIYPYAVLDRAVVRGYPAFALSEMPKILEVPGGRVYSTLLPHGPIEVLGLVFERNGKRIAYYTDCSGIPDEALELARSAEVVVLDGLRSNPHPSHMTIDQAVEAAERIGGHQTFLTHMTCTVDHGPVDATLPEGVRLAYDGLRIEV